ncbi:hypothetical protein SS50377_25423 [Spironucleus salmonicida]|uniref:Uncharacterized protein n=1 Tax=Spironucleus salmonicida TaxID=348837 RepID=V6LVX2_9EUKA|nr:hypothetical protein SS50377_25423 [Spironucleus salmonicida]|eukprot:EST44969.1 Hypothetical protein SS50377_14987 [Spironucleus salmonicida]
MDFNSFISNQLKATPHMLRLQQQNLTCFPSINKSLLQKCAQVQLLNLKDNNFSSLSDLAKSLTIFSSLQILLLDAEAEDDVLMDFATVGDLRVLDDLVLNEDEVLEQYNDQISAMNQEVEFMDYQDSFELQISDNASLLEAAFVCDLNNDQFLNQIDISRQFKAFMSRNCEIDLDIASFPLGIEYLDLQQCTITNFDISKLAIYQKLKIVKINSIQNCDIEQLILENPDIVKVNDIIIGLDTENLDQYYGLMFQKLENYNQFIDQEEEMQDILQILEDSETDLKIEDYLQNDGKLLKLINLNSRQVQLLLNKIDSDVDKIIIENCDISNIKQFNGIMQIKMLSIYNCYFQSQDLEKTLCQFKNLQYMFLGDNLLNQVSSSILTIELADLLQINQQPIRPNTDVLSASEIINQSQVSSILSVNNSNILSPGDQEMENLLKDVLLSQQQSRLKQSAHISDFEDDKEIDLNNSVSDICEQIQQERNSLLIQSEYVHQDPIKVFSTPYSKTNILSAIQIKSLIPDITKHLTKQDNAIPQQNDNAQKQFYEFKTQLNQVENVNQVSLNLIIQQFHNEVNQLIHNQEIGTGYQIFDDNLDQIKLKYQSISSILDSSNKIDVDFVPEKPEESDFNHNSKLIYAQIKINTLQKESFTHQKASIQSVTNFHALLYANQQILEIYQINAALQLSLHHINSKNIETRNQIVRIQKIFNKFMSKLKKLSNLLIFKKNQAQNEDFKANIFENQKLQGSQFIKKDNKVQSNLFSVNQIVSIFNLALKIFSQNNRKEMSQFDVFFNNQFFNTKFGLVFGQIKKTVFYESLKVQKQNSLVQVIQLVIDQKKYEFYSSEYHKIQQVCIDLLIGSVFELDNALDQEVVEKKVQCYKNMKIPAQYWTDALETIDPLIGYSDRQKQMTFDELVGFVLLWKINQ